MTKLVWTREEILADHAYAAPQVEAGYRLHGGFDGDGKYISPRTLNRWPAIRAWSDALKAHGHELVDSSQQLMVGGAFATPAGSVTEIANGWYQVAGNATDTSALGPLLLHATATGADPCDALYEVVAFDPQSATNLGLTNLDAAVSSRSTFAGGAVASVTGSVGSVVAAVTLPAIPAAWITAAFGGVIRSGLTVPQITRSIADAGTPATPSASRAAAIPSVADESDGPANRRSAMPVRRRIHSSDVSSHSAKVVLGTRRSGRHIPAPRTVTLRTASIARPRRPAGVRCVGTWRVVPFSQGSTCETTME